MLSHPAFSQVKDLLGISFRILFTTKQELDALLRAHGYRPVPRKSWDNPGSPEWIDGQSQQYFAVDGAIFDSNGVLRADTSTAWDEGWILLKNTEFPEVDDYDEVDDDE